MTKPPVNLPLCRKLTAVRGPSPRRFVSTRCALSVGIDLGTTNSAVSVLKEGSPVVVPNHLGRLTTPSVVTFREGGEVVVGEEARRLAGTYPYATFASVKRVLGRDFDAVAKAGQPFGCDLIRGETGEIWLRCDTVQEKRVRPEDVSAEVVRYLLKCASEACNGEKVQKCVISVPAYFDEQQRAATVAAGLSAGLEKVRLIHEPVASALAYGLDLQKDQTVCVFDLGGGTLDICLLELGNGVTEVLATGGNSQLGGDDVDAAIVKWLLKEHLAYIPSLRRTAKFRADLKKLSEMAKIKLSTGKSVRIKIPVKGETVDVLLSRAQLERLCKPLFVEMRSALDRCCWQAGVDLMSLRDMQETKDMPLEIRAKDRIPVSEILLVGAATKMPAVGRFLQNMTGLEIHTSNVDPDQCVAMGTAIEAARLSQALSEDFVMVDVWKAALARALVTDQMTDS